MWSSIHPTLMGGEYLPEPESDSVEIANISMCSTMADVISIRAIPEGGKIVYSIVDEYDVEFEFEPTSSDQPLTLEEMIRLIDGAYAERWEGRGGLCDFFIGWRYEDGDDEETILNFLTISSGFYPDLGDFFRERSANRLRVARSRDRRWEPDSPQWGYAALDKYDEVLDGDDDDDQSVDHDADAEPDDEE